MPWKWFIRDHRDKRANLCNIPSSWSYFDSFRILQKCMRARRRQNERVDEERESATRQLSRLTFWSPTLYTIRPHVRYESAASSLFSFSSSRERMWVERNANPKRSLANEKKEHKLKVRAEKNSKKIFLLYFLEWPRARDEKSRGWNFFPFHYEQSTHKKIVVTALVQQLSVAFSRSSRAVALFWPPELSHKAQYTEKQLKKLQLKVWVLVLRPMVSSLFGWRAWLIRIFTLPDMKHQGRKNLETAKRKLTKTKKSSHEVVFFLGSLFRCGSLKGAVAGNWSAWITLLEHAQNESKEPSRGTQKVVQFERLFALDGLSADSRWWLLCYGCSI